MTSSNEKAVAVAAGPFPQPSLPCFAPRTFAAGCTALKRKLIPPLHVDVDATRVKPSVDSMRASSPTRTAAVSSAGGGISAWLSEHPSALREFEKIAAAASGRRIAVFLDYDGTLSPIVDDPDAAFLSSSMREAVRGVAKCFPTAIVSGRCIDKVYAFIALPELYYAGSHGMDIKAPVSGNEPSISSPEESVLFQPAREFLPMIDEVYNLLLENTKCTPGARVENNKFCASVHFRCVDENIWSSLAEQVHSVLKGYPKLRLTQGRKVFEVRPTIKWDKGRALEFLLESLGFAGRADVLPLYIGDDRTDEDAFTFLKKSGQGLGILVSNRPKETNASYTLQDPAEVQDFLLRLVDLDHHARM